MSGVRILVVGAGATGGYFGGRLVQAGRDVTFLVRPARAAALASGLRIKSPEREDVIDVRTVTAGALDGPYDVILLGVKARGLAGAIADMAPAVGPDTVIIPMLNGMRHMAALQERFGDHRVWGGICMIFATMTDSGEIVQMTGLHRLAYGPLDGSHDPRAGAVHDALSGAGFTSDLTSTAEQEMWEKWMLLAGLGAVTTLMRADVGAVNTAPGGRAFTAGVAAEVIAAITGAGHPPRPGAVAFLRAAVETTEPATSSMYRDMMAGNPVEADEIIGDLVGYAEQNAVPAPLLAAAYTNLAIYAASRPA